MTIGAMSRVEYLLLEAALPGIPPQPIGVLLHDPESGRLGVRLRRDWDRVAGPDEVEVFQALAASLEDRAREGPAKELLAWLEDTLSNSIRVSERKPVAMGRFESTLRLLYERSVPTDVRPFRTHLPVYSCRAAAGHWGELQAEEEGWVETPDGMRLTEDMFVAHVEGRSMEPVIPDGSLCVFRGNVVGTRQGKRVLVENQDESEAGGNRYTVKRWISKKTVDPDGWRHESIRLEPLNPDFEAWELAEDSRCRVVAEFVRVLD